jgi:beta-glucosidase
MESNRYRSLLLFSLIAISTCVFSQEFKYPFLNPNLSIDDRVKDLVSRLTLEEKVDQLMYNTKAISRLDIPEYNWWSECLHGVARNGRATVFPQAIGMAATFDTDLIYRIGAAIADEGRAKFNACSAEGYRGIYQGLTFWTPNVNLFRDPRWGRGQETYGEDPFLTSRIGVAFVKGLQGDHPKYLKAAACAKHYAVHSGPEAKRHEFDAVVSQKELWETYLPAFEALVTEANVEGVMGAYNRTNGDPCCAHPYLMQEVLRKEWDFQGYFTSDCWAIVDFYDGHNVVKTPVEAAAMALKAGCNLNCGSTYPQIVQAVEQGLVTEADVDRNLSELLGTRFRLGLFDPPEMVPFNSISSDVIRCKKHIELTHEAASKAIVLLKNKDNLLPLNKDIGKVYVCGPMATHMQALLANYYGLSEEMVTVLEGIINKVSDFTSVQYRQGALLDRQNINPIDWFSDVAGESDVTIACLGISQLIEGEEGEAIASPNKGDRAGIRLPQNQIDFLKTIRGKANKLVVVLTGGSAIACPEVYEMADALLFIWYPGEQGGHAVADIIFGDIVPSGRLPITFPMSLKDLPDYEDYSMTGRTYRYMEKEPLFPFGFGLSYTTFKYSDLKLSAKEVEKGESVTAEVKITNTGKLKAEEVVQLYITDLKASTRVPFYSLKGFQRVTLTPGESKNVTFEITPELMQMVDDDGKRVIEKGMFRNYWGCMSGAT